MYKYPLWKYILVILVMVYAVIYTLPNFYQTYPSIIISDHEEKTLSNEEVSRLINSSSFNFKGVDDNVIFFDSIDDQLNAYNQLNTNSKHGYTLSNYDHIPKWLYAINAQPVSLGLDLKGGVHFLLQIDTNNVIKARATQLENNLRNFLIDNGIRYTNVTNDNNLVNFTLSEQNIDAETVDSLSQTFSDYDVEVYQDDDLNYINARLSESSIADDIKASMKKNLTILRSRVDELGVSQPIIQRQGKDRIIVQLPGLQDSTRAKNILGSTATLEFRMTKGCKMTGLHRILLDQIL